jgi:imidazolonepropionase-like amidohydrolase
MRLFLWIAVVSIGAHLSTPVWARSIVLRNATVVDVAGGSNSRNATIVITGNRIATVGAANEVEVPPDAEVVDVTGKFVIPGLWDMHVHWYLEEYLPLFIANGVTGARMMWGTPLHHRWRRAITEGVLLGPRLVIGSSVIDGPNPVWPGSTVAGTPEAGRAAVRAAKQARADFVKVYERLSKETYLAIADEAQRQNLRIVGHVPGSMSAVEAARAGQHSIEHLSGVLAASSTWREEPSAVPGASSAAELASTSARAARDRLRSASMLEGFSSEKANAVLREFVRHRTWHAPTLTILRSLAYQDDQDFRNDERLKYVPREVKDFWQPDANWRIRNLTVDDFVLAKQEYRKQLEVVGMMHRAGVSLLAGTDVLNPFCLPGFSMHDELQLLVDAGLTPLDALRTATLGPARFLGRERDYGTVEAGKVADLVVLDADPTDAIDNVRRIWAVVADGRLLDRTALEALLARAEASAAKAPVPPLPRDLVITPPSTDIADDVAAFSGKWVGQWSQSLDHVLVVTKAEGRKVTFVYSVGLDAANGIRPGFTIVNGEVDEAGVLRGTLTGARLAYRFSEDRKTLTAEFVRPEFTTHGILRRE